jgi:succinyl-diaminopimelate desuccinylase
MKETSPATQPYDFRALLEECVDFAQRLIQTPSMPGEEGPIAELVADQLRRLSFDEVRVDAVGNVIGRVYGRDRTLPVLVLNSHLDHVDPGDLSLWALPPYSAEIVDGRIVGRGACDIKGPLAVQVYALSTLLSSGRRPRRDVVFTGVVQEETGGAGALHWAQHCEIEVALVVLGEPSENRLSLGHRGLYQVWVTFTGRSAHASAPESGQNPNFALATFLRRLERSSGELGRHPVLGPTTVAPTVVEVDTTSLNVTPAWTRVLLDFRTGSETPDSLRAFVDRLAEGYPYEIREAFGGLSDIPNKVISGFYTPPGSPLVPRVQELIARGMGRLPELSHYQFATDGRHFVPCAMPVLGFGPGEERLAHTANESVSISMLAEGLRGYTALLEAF